MSNKPLSVGRRAFLNGHWVPPAAAHSNPIAEIASIIVQTRPDRLDAAAQVIAALPGTQIFSRDRRGKLVVVIESAEVGRIGATLNTISSMAEVLTAALVFHATDAG